MNSLSNPGKLRPLISGLLLIVLVVYAFLNSSVLNNVNVGGTLLSQLEPLGIIIGILALCALWVPLFPVEMSKLTTSIILTMLWICVFLFFNDNLVIQWSDTSITNLTALKPIIEFIGFLVIFFYNLLNGARPGTQKLSWTAFLTIVWLALILFYPFRDPNNYYGGAMGFFTLIGGLAVCVLWVHFFSDEVIA